METIWSKASDMIREHGWVKEGYGDSRQGFCLVGSLIVASGKRVWLDHGYFEPYVTNDCMGSGEVAQAYKVVAQALGVGEHWTSWEVTQWNDKEATTKEDVLNLFQELHEKELAERGEL